MLLRTQPGLDLVVRSATVHLVVVSAISACALAVAMVTAVAPGAAVTAAWSCSRSAVWPSASSCSAAVAWPVAGGGVAPLPGEASVRLALVVAAAAVLVAVGAVHWWRWRLGFDRVQLALVVACLLAAGALVSLQVGALWRLSWWDYHAFLLTGFAAAIYAVLTGYRRSRALERCWTGCSPATRWPTSAGATPRPCGP